VVKRLSPPLLAAIGGRVVKIFIAVVAALFVFTAVAVGIVVGVPYYAHSQAVKAWVRDKPARVALAKDCEAQATAKWPSGVSIITDDDEIRLVSIEGGGKEWQVLFRYAYGLAGTHVLSHSGSCFYSVDGTFLNALVDAGHGHKAIIRSTFGPTPLQGGR